jgi:hypothetical protein
VERGIRDHDTLAAARSPACDVIGKCCSRAFNQDKKGFAEY